MERRILEECFRMRMPVPKAIQNAPELNLGLGFVYSSFWELRTDAVTGFGHAVLSRAAIHKFVTDHELDQEDAADLTFLVRAMDRVYLEHCEEDREKKRKKSSKS